MTLAGDGVNVAVVSRHATGVLFCVFDDSGEEELYRFVLPRRLGDVHFGFVSGLGAGARYGFRAEGPWDEAGGHRFDAAKLLIDPYASAIDRPFFHYPELLERGFDTAALVPKCVVTEAYEIAAPLPPAAPRLIYELQVRSFSKLHPKIPAIKRGTVAALAEPAILDHLVKLGVDTVEIMPLAAWIDERHLPPLGLSNAWAYNPVTFMAPDPRLAPGGFAEIRAAVEALHGAGIRVLLDVVFNHTGESDEGGATLSLRGLDNALYYAHADGRLVNHTGCGNTLALDRAPAMRLVMDAMRNWVNRTGVDGFRFDLAPVMGRTTQGFSIDAPLLAAIEQDPLLSGLTMIAEPWDVGPEGYRLGQFPGRWHEWNDRFRDDVRRFWRGDVGAVGALATRLAGSSDIFAPYRLPSRGINFAAAHDGFTLRDAVIYAAKDNHANGEGNRDGNGHETTWAKGDVRALLATLLLSRGLPMLTAGDEFGRSQQGNNNAYAQDNAITWLDWDKADAELIEFTASLVKLRMATPLLAADRFLTGAADPHTRLADALWLGADGGPMDWSDRQARVLGLVLAEGANRVAIWINGGGVAQSPVFRARDGYRWSRVFSSADGEGLPAHSVSLHVEEAIAAVGISDDGLRELAAAAGVEPDWWEVDGTHHLVAPDSLRAMLAALRIPHGTPEDARGSLHRLRTMVPPQIGRAGEGVVLGAPSERRRRLHIAAEDGSTSFVDVAPGAVPTAPLAMGYYRLWNNDDQGNQRQIIVSPGQCYLPGDIAAGHRVHGLAAHLYALRHKGDGGIGDLRTLQRFAKLTADCGGCFSGLNPLHHLFPQDRERASPYQPSDRRFIDPIYISIDALLAAFPLARTRKLATSQRAAFARLEALPAVDYTAVWTAKSALLEAAFAEFKTDADLDRFIAAGGSDLARHCAYETAAAGESADPQRQRYRSFLQWIADRQLATAAERRTLYRDLAVGCAFDGGEIAEAPEYFAPGVSLGAPPDPFARHGQLWELPPFSPLALAQAEFMPLRSILAANMRHAAALRIDHILGFMRQFWVPSGAEGRDGAYVRFPLEALIAITAIESQRARCLVVGEDLGTIPDGLREALAAAQILSYRVLWFERDGVGFKPASAYPRLALACLASHDLPSFMGWRQARDIDIDRDLGLIDAATASARRTKRAAEMRALDTLTGARTGTAEEACVAAHGFIAATASAVMLVQADDLAGETEPLNVPGTNRERPNWRRRLSCNVEALATRPLAKAILRRVKAERPA